MIVELSKDEVRVCTQLATERWLTKWESIDRPNYAQGKANGKLEHELLASIRANVCEWAAAKHYGLTWSVPWYPNHEHWARRHLPDIGTTTEVRSVRTATAIPIWEKDEDKVIVATQCLDLESFSQVFVYGMTISTPYMVDEYFDESIGGWRIPLDEFVECNEIRNI
jgi:hypothetical protein